MVEALKLLASIWFYGDFKGETCNERRLKSIMEGFGLWPLKSEAALFEILDRPRLSLLPNTKGDGGEEEEQGLTRAGAGASGEGPTASPSAALSFSGGDNAEHFLRLRTQQLETMRRAWVRAAEQALTVLPGASNSMHPAYDLWLRVEMSKVGPVEVVQSSPHSAPDQSGGAAADAARSAPEAHSDSRASKPRLDGEREG